jgi:hypothetical protein
MNSSHTAAATVELPYIISEIHRSSTNATTSRSRTDVKQNQDQRKVVNRRSATSPNVTPDSLPPTGVDQDLELMNISSVVGREAGERDPLLLRSKIIPDTELDGIRQYVYVVLPIHSSCIMLILIVAVRKARR